MFIELIDLLRCPNEHEDSWLVAAFTRMEGRFVIEGKLGCPVCSASYPIAGGVAEFAPAPKARPAFAGTASDDDAIRIAAMLDLTRAGSVAILEGSLAIMAHAIVTMTEARVITLNAAAPLAERERVAGVTAARRLPVAAGSVDGIMIESGSREHLAEVLRVLKPSGRIVAPADTEPGQLFREIARDDRNVVGEKAGPLLALGRAISS